MSNLYLLSWVRFLAGFHLMCFQLISIGPYYSEVYSESRFFNNHVEGVFKYLFFDSVLSFLPDSALFAIYLIWIVLAFMLMSGFRLRYVIPLLVVLNSQFYHLNPLIVHEPQQLLNLLIILFIFIKTETFNIFELFKFREKLILPSATEEGEQGVYVKLLLVYIGCYYLLAGVKKLPDEGWSHGVALIELFEWNGILRNWVEGVFSVQQFRYVKPVLKFMNYFTISFELLFLPILLTKYRWVLLPIGLFFHLLNTLFFDVGLFHMAMFMFYPLLFSRVSFFKTLFNQFKIFLHRRGLTS